jgi:hypothetical protein
VFHHYDAHARDGQNVPWSFTDFHRRRKNGGKTAQKKASSQLAFIYKKRAFIGPVSAEPTAYKTTMSYVATHIVN